MFFKRYHFSIINFDLSCIFVFLTYSARLSWVNMSFIGIATAPRNIFSNRRSQAQMVAFSVFPKTASIGIWYVTCQKIVLIRLWFFLLMLRLLAHTIFIVLPQTVKMFYLSVVIRWKLVKGYQLSTFMLDVTPITCLSTPWWVSLSEKNVSSGIVTAPRNIFSHTVPQSQSVAWSVLHFTTSIGILYSSWKIKISSVCLNISSSRLLIDIKKCFVVCVFIYTHHFHKRRMTIFANYFCLALCCLRWIRM